MIRRVERTSEASQPSEDELDRLFEGEGRCAITDCRCGGRLLVGHPPCEELERMSEADRREDPGVAWLGASLLAAAAVWAAALALLASCLPNG